MLPSIFGENMLDEFFDDSFDRDFFGSGRNPLYGKHAKNLMKTDIREKDNGYELAVDLPGFSKDEVSVDQKAVYVEDFIRTHKRFSFRALLEKQHSKVEVIVTFLVVLELMKTGKITVEQASINDDMTVISREEQMA